MRRAVCGAPGCRTSAMTRAWKRAALSGVAVDRAVRQTRIYSCLTEVELRVRKLKRSRDTSVIGWPEARRRAICRVIADDIRGQDPEAATVENMIDAEIENRHGVQ